MAEYIERSKVLVIIDEIHGARSAYHRVHNLPAADVAPAVHGEWLVGYTDTHNRETGVECSECNAFFTLSLFDFGLCYNYCPNCGARMDGAE